MDTLGSMLELAETSKRNTPDQYIDNIKDAWTSHHELLDACKNDDSLSEKKVHIKRIQKRIETIEAELSSLGIDPAKLKLPEDEDNELLGELNSDENVDELSIGDSDEDGTKVTKVNAKPISKLPTMEEKKQSINSRSSQVVNDISNHDVDAVMT